MRPDGSGLVFNIQRFSVHDGPGIRTTVFMKGCPLRCWWCSNPESQSFTPQLMVRDVLCTGCGACVEACPVGAISVAEGQGRRIDRDRCDHCLLCVDRCLYGSLNRCGASMTVDEVMEEVLRDRDFYRNSGGGVTVSGGEPLSQSGFVEELLARCGREGLHRVLDTSGHAPGDDLERVARQADLVLFDIKHLDPAIHREATGVSNDLILENLRRVPESAAVWLRVPLIRGFNDSEEQVGGIARLGKELALERLSLLPYHEGGLSKSTQLGMDSPVPAAAAPDEEHCKKLADMVKALGVTASIGV